MVIKHALNFRLYFYSNLITDIENLDITCPMNYV